MFTGLIMDMGRVESVTAVGDGARLALSTGLDGLNAGDSVSVSGVCVTVATRTDGRFEADLSPETLSRTTLGVLEPGSRVNLEPALRAGDALGGHLVTGHVDGIGVLEERLPRSECERWHLRVPARLHRFMAEKGSVCVDGVSLTVNAVEDDRVVLDLIPHTLSVTTLGQMRSGSRMNLEVDLIARYVERLLSCAR